MSVTHFELFDGREFQYGPALAVAAETPNRVLVYYPLGSGKTLAAVHAARTWMDKTPGGLVIVITTKVNIEATWSVAIDMYVDAEPIDLANVHNADWWFSSENNAHYNRLIRELASRESRAHCVALSVTALRELCKRHGLDREWRQFLTDHRNQMRQELRKHIRKKHVQAMDTSEYVRACQTYGIDRDQSLLQASIPHRPYLLIVDECQEYVNDSANYRLISTLATSADFSLFLSATPVRDKADGLYRLLGENEWGFTKNFPKKFLYTDIRCGLPTVVSTVATVAMTASEWRSRGKGGAYLCRTRQSCNSDSKWEAMAAQIEHDIEFSTGPLRIVVYSYFLEAGIEGFLTHLVKKFAGRAKRTRFSFKVGNKMTQCSLMGSNEEGLHWFNRKSTRNKILLLSSRSGTGISLQNVGYFHLMEPQWSVDEEEQAIGRATRKGSHTLVEPTVHVYRWIATPPQGTCLLSADQQMNQTKAAKQQRTSAILQKWQDMGTVRLAALLSNFEALTLYVGNKRNDI